MKELVDEERREERESKERRGKVKVGGSGRLVVAYK